MSAIDEYRLLILTVPEHAVIRDLDLPQDIRYALQWFQRFGYVDVITALDSVLRQDARFPHPRERMRVLHAHMFDCLGAHVPPAWIGHSSGWDAKACRAWLGVTGSAATQELLQDIRPFVNGAWHAMLKVAGDVSDFSAGEPQRDMFSVLANLRSLHDNVAPIFTPNFFDYATTGMESLDGSPAKTLLRWV